MCTKKKGRGQGGKLESLFPLSIPVSSFTYQFAAERSREKYHLCTSVSGRNIKHKLWKPSCIFPRVQPFRCKLLQLHCKTLHAEELSGQRRRKKWNRWICFAVSQWESSAEILVQLYWFLHQQMADNIPCVCIPFGKSQVTSGLASVLSEQMEAHIRYRLQQGNGEMIGRSVHGGGRKVRMI